MFFYDISDIDISNFNVLSTDKPHYELKSLKVEVL